MFQRTNWRRFLPAVLGLGFLLASCDREEHIAGGSDDTHSSVVDIQGRVLTKDARPYGNVIVRLRGLGLSDTTDGEGLFRFRHEQRPTAGRAADAVDTVDYLRDGQTILSVPVPAWIATLPDVMLVQRDLSGNLLGDLTGVARVVCQLGMPDGSRQSIDLELNGTSRRYSGFAYFRYTGGVDSFTARVVVLDSAGTPMGTGPTLHFTSRAGDIAFPDLGATNALPRLRLRGELAPREGHMTMDPSGLGPDTMSWSETPRASRRQGLILHAELTDSQLVAARVEWFLDGKWIPASRPTRMPWTGCPVCMIDFGPEPVLPSVSLHFDTTVNVPADAEWGWWPRVRVIDSLGRIFEDTLRVKVVPVLPVVALRVKDSLGGWGSRAVVVPGVNLQLGLEASEATRARIVSRRLYVGRTIYRSEGPAGPVDPWTGSSLDLLGGVVQKPGSPFGLPEIEVQGPDPLAETRSFRRTAPSVEVSGQDTVLVVPRDSLGEFGIVYEVVDEDGDTGIARATFLVRPPAPRIDSLIAGSDSVVVTWSYDLWPAPARGGTWIATGGWQGVSDTFRLEVPGDVSRLALARPLGARSLRLSLRRAFVNEGVPADTLLSGLPPQVLTFTGASFDTSRLGGVAGSIGPRGFGHFSAGPGVRLAGEVARLAWSAGDAFDVSGAFAWFPLAVEGGTRRFHADVANRSSVDVRVLVTASSVASYSEQVASGRALHWIIPAGFEGPMDLDVEALRWPVWAQESDTLGIDRNQVVANIDAIQFEIVQFQDSTVRSGVLELDNLGWR